MNDHDKIRYIDQKVHELAAKTKLEKQIRTTIMTATIFCLQQCEDTFGELWGEKLDDEKELNDSQRQYDAKYEQMREAILDNMNRQIKIACKNLNNYKITF